jgi:hypothetical protein
MFAALQVSCKGRRYPATLSVSDMLGQLHLLLLVEWWDSYPVRARPELGTLAAQREPDMTIDYFYVEEVKVEKGAEIVKLTIEEEERNRKRRN